MKPWIEREAPEFEILYANSDDGYIYEINGGRLKDPYFTHYVLVDWIVPGLERCLGVDYQEITDEQYAEVTRIRDEWGDQYVGDYLARYRDFVARFRNNNRE